MEKLEISQKESIKKMSSVRLASKLLEAGVEEDKVQAMDRNQLMAAWAEIVLAGKDKPVAAASPLGYDPDLERQRLEFEIRKYEEEKEERRLKYEEEKEERRLRHEEERRLKERELQIQIDRERESKSLVSKTKVYADALKGTIARMPADVVHLLTYFKDVEQLFDRFEVPRELRAHLLRPYLNDKAKILVSRMDPKVANNYKEVKNMLLREFKLSPALYLDKFNTDTRKQDETCVLYSARLAAILDAYLDSRHINQSYEKLTSLLVCDKIKNTLPDGCLKHILAIESSKPDGWLQVHDLAEAVDLYFANRWQHNDRPRVGALGIPASTKSVGSNPKTFGNSNDNQKAGNANTKSAVGSGEPIRRCFLCGSKSHLKNECPEKGKSNAARPNAKVNTCQVQERQEFMGRHTPLMDTKFTQSAEVKDTEVQVCAEPCLFDDTVLTDEIISVQSQVVDVSIVNDECEPVCNDCAKLQYMYVKTIDQDFSDVKVVSGMNDGGAEISVIRTDMLDKLDVPHIGRVKLRGIVGSPVEADLVKLNVALSNCDDKCSEYIPVLCAVCPEANDNLVLASNVVDSLFERQSPAAQVNAVTQLDVNDTLDVKSDEPVVTDNDNGDVMNQIDEDVDIDTLQQDDGNVNADEVNDINCVYDVSHSQAKADAEKMHQEQIGDETLKGWWSIAKRGKGGFTIRNNLLYYTEKILGQSFSQLCLPKCRRAQVLELAHDTFGGHLGSKRTRDRIRLSFTWPTLTSDCKKYCQTCNVCQKRARKTYRARVPITPVPRAEAPFTHWFIDCFGPILNQKTEYNYCLVMCDSATKWPAAYPLKSLTAKNVCQTMLQLWMITGVE